MGGARRLWAAMRPTWCTGKISNISIRGRMCLLRTARRQPNICGDCRLQGRQCNGNPDVPSKARRGSRLIGMPFMPRLGCDTLREILPMARVGAEAPVDSVDVCVGRPPDDVAGR